MKNVTITMDEATLRWIRVEAAQSGMSVSRWIARELEGRFAGAAEKAAARDRVKAFLNAGPRFDLSEDGKINIDRDELYDDGRFRRFDDPALHPGSSESDEARALDSVAEPAARFESDDPKPAGSK
jgi:hypothetical protein